MKTINIYSFAKLFILAAIIISSNSIKSMAKDGEGKVTEKAREAVKLASPDDWLTLAKSAQKCFNKGENLKEALEWLNRSIEIKPTAFNLLLKGDYYAMNKLPNQAIRYYVKSLNISTLNNQKEEINEAQTKIAIQRKEIVN